MPFINNRNGISCIPPGKYLVRPRSSAKYGKHFHIVGSKDSNPPYSNIPNSNTGPREWVLIHTAPNSGWLAGCIGPGTEFNSDTTVHTYKDKYAKDGKAGNVDGNPYGMISKGDSIKGLNKLRNTLWKKGKPEDNSFYLLISNSSNLRDKGTPEQLNKLGIAPTVGK